MHLSHFARKIEHALTGGFIKTHPQLFYMTYSKTSFHLIVRNDVVYHSIVLVSYD